MLEVFADIACPYAHVTLGRLDERRRQAGLAAPLLGVRAWPLELVNDMAHDSEQIEEEVAALRDQVAAGRFAGFDAAAFPTTTLPALASEAAAYRAGPAIGERFSLAVRDALWEQGLDVADAAVLRRLRRDHGVPDPTDPDATAPRRDWEEGQARGVQGSPHVFTPTGGSFSPTLTVVDDGGKLTITADDDAYDRLVAAGTGA